MKGWIGLILVIIALVGFFGFATLNDFAVGINARRAYETQFGSDVAMLTTGASSLVGTNGISDVGSMHYYLMSIWNKMNETWKGRDYYHTYANEENLMLGTLGKNVPENTLAKTNEWMNSLNASLYTKQKQLDEGKIQSADPLQTALNQSRQEVNAYGGIDWVIKPLWMRENQPSYYYMPITMLWVAIIAAIIGIIGVILMFIAYIQS